MPKRDWRHHTPLGVGLAVAILLALAGSINHYKESERAYQTAKQEYEESKVVKPPGAADAKRPYTDPKAYREEWRSESNLDAQWQVVKWATVSALATMVGIIILAATFWETARAAEGAYQAAEVAERSLRIVQRAHLSVEPLGIKQRRVGVPWFGTVGIRNAGHMPARDMNWFICVQPFKPDKGWKPTDYNQPRKGNHVVPPGSALRFSSPPFSVDPRGQDEQWLYIWGEVTYFDGLDTTERKFTKFCHRYHIRAIVMDEKKSAHVPIEDARDHIHGNDAT